MKVNVTADVFVLTSNITLEQYNVLKKLNPSALEIKADPDEGIEPFVIVYAEGKTGVINENQVQFNTVSRDSNKYLCLSGRVPNGEDAKKYVADLIAPAYASLKKFEETIATAATVASNERQALEAVVEIN